MKKSIICILALCLFLLSSPAFAEKWVLIERVTNKEFTYVTGGPYNHYINADSVIKEGDYMVFTEKRVADGTDEYGITKTWVTITEADLSAGKYRPLEAIEYSASGEVTAHTIMRDKWYNNLYGKLKYTPQDYAIKAALKYARKGKIDVQEDIQNPPWGSADWVLVERVVDEHETAITGGPYIIYIDANSVINDGDKLIYWEKRVLDSTKYIRSKVGLSKIEVNLSTKYDRALETVLYDDEGRMFYYDIQPHGWSVFPFEINSEKDRTNNFALQYANRGEQQEKAPQTEEDPET